jgi:ribosomal protein S14
MLKGQQLEEDQRNGEERAHRRCEKCGNREGKGKI